MSVTPEAALGAALSPLLGGLAKPVIGVAVSGGGDSTALLLLAHEWGQSHGVTLRVATVNHGLRPAAAAEAAGVAELAARLGLPHDTLLWQGWNSRGNLMAAARSARRELLAEWARGAGIAHVLLGHTADDQAETVLMRLARGSGVDGLRGMDVADPSGLFLRPLLSVSREELRDWLAVRGQAWIDDPTNDDPAYDRVKARQMMDGLADLGLTRARILETAAHMARAQETLRAAAAEFAARHYRAEGGDLVLSPQALDLGAGDSAGRCLAAALSWFAASPYRPRYDALQDAARAVQAGDTRTLSGVILLPHPEGARLLREERAVQGPAAFADGALWDGRWRVTGAGDPAWQIAALGALGLVQCPDWRETGLPRQSLLASPAIWHETTLIAAPLAGKPCGFSAQPCPSYHDYLLLH